MAVFLVNKSLNIHHKYNEEIILTFEKEVQKLLTKSLGIEFHPTNRTPTKYWLTKLTDKECYLLGSSRVMLIQKKNNSYIDEVCGSFLNLWGPTGDLLSQIKWMPLLINKKNIKKIFI